MPLLNKCLEAIVEAKKNKNEVCLIKLSSQELNNVEPVYQDLESLGYAFQPVWNGLQIWNLYEIDIPPAKVKRGELTKSQCAEIIRMYREGEGTLRTLGKRFGKHTSAISKVLKGEIFGS